MWKRTKLIVLASIVMLQAVGISFLLAQTPSQQDPMSVDVKAIVLELKSGVYSGIGNTRLSRLGDQAAAVALRSYTPDELRDEALRNALADMISISFSHPKLIENVEARSPRSSMLLLSGLKAAAASPASHAAVDRAYKVIGSQHQPVN